MGLFLGPHVSFLFQLHLHIFSFWKTLLNSLGLLLPSPKQFSLENYNVYKNGETSEMNFPYTSHLPAAAVINSHKTCHLLSHLRYCYFMCKCSSRHFQKIRAEKKYSVNTIITITMLSKLTAPRYHQISNHCSYLLNYFWYKFVLVCSQWDLNMIQTLSLVDKEVYFNI